MASTTTYRLAHPITRKLRVSGGGQSEETIEELEIRRLNGGDIRWMETQAGKPGQSLGLVARLTGKDATVVDMLDAEDIAGISELVASFLPPSLVAGATS